MSLLIKRRDAAQATLDKFSGVPFHYGHQDCARMVTFHLHKLGVALAITKAGRYSSALGAQKALKRLGFAKLSEVLDAHGLERIAPAQAIVGDIIEMPGLEGPGALVVAMGNGRVLGYHENVIGAAVLQPIDMLAAWRSIPHG